MVRILLNSEGRESTDNDQYPGRPASVSTGQTVAKINETVNADKETVRKILHYGSLCEVGAKNP